MTINSIIKIYKDNKQLVIEKTHNIAEKGVRQVVSHISHNLNKCLMKIHKGFANKHLNIIIINTFIK